LNGIREALIVLCGFGWDSVAKDSAVESVDECVSIGVVDNGLEFALAVLPPEVGGYNVGFMGPVTESQLPERGAGEEDGFGIVGVMETRGRVCFLLFVMQLLTVFTGAPLAGPR